MVEVVAGRALADGIIGVAPGDPRDGGVEQRTQQHERSKSPTGSNDHNGEHHTKEATAACAILVRAGERDDTLRARRFTAPNGAIDHVRSWA